MANESYYSTSGDVRLTATLAREYQLILADRFSLFGHPAIYYAGSAAATGSTAIKVPLVGLNGYDRMSAIAEAASGTNTAVTDSSVTITIARQYIQRQISDLNEAVDTGIINVGALIADGLGAYVMRWMEMYCSLLGGFTSTVGTSGVNMDVDDYFSAAFTLIQASVRKPWLCTLYPVQLTDFLNALRAEGGAIQMRTETQDLFDLQGSGMVGSFLGADIVPSSLVTTANAGADSAGAMHGYGAIGYADGLPRAIRGAGEVIFPAGTKLYTELERDASGALTKVVHNAMMGWQEMQDSMGVSMITDR